MVTVRSTHLEGLSAHSARTFFDAYVVKVRDARDMRISPEKFFLWRLALGSGLHGAVNILVAIVGGRTTSVFFVRMSGGTEGGRTRALLPSLCLGAAVCRSGPQNCEPSAGNKVR